MRGQALTFAALDGLAFAAARGRLENLPKDGGYAVSGIGPFLELAQLADFGLLPQPHEARWLALEGIAAFEAALRARRQYWICPASRAVGFFRTRTTWEEEDKEWFGFGLAAQKAATAAGFHRRIAAQFAAALDEMVSNIHEHSHAPESGIAAFRAGTGEFEFAVADRGIGVRDSLRNCSDYSQLEDHGQALRLALADGVSRFGQEAKRGGGFRPIFVGLANLSGTLRFRSGDHGLVVDGQKLGAMPAKTAQKEHLQGFLACVSCRLSHKCAAMP